MLSRTCYRGILVHSLSIQCRSHVFFHSWKFLSQSDIHKDRLLTFSAIDTNWKYLTNRFLCYMTLQQDVFIMQLITQTGPDSIKVLQLEPQAASHILTWRNLLLTKTFQRISFSHSFSFSFFLSFFFVVLKKKNVGNFCLIFFAILLRNVGRSWCKHVQEIA